MPLTTHGTNISDVKIRRFKVEDCTGPTVHLVGREARHALRVLRLSVGDLVTVFDGRGGEAIGRIAARTTDGLTVEIQQPARAAEASATGLILAVAAPKGSRADWMVEKSAELGVSALWLLQTERGTVAPGAAKVERWRRKAVEAAKQAGQNAVMTIEPPRTPAEALAAAAGLAILYAHPSPAGVGLMHALGWRPGDIAAGRPLVIFIGPEGGFTDDECRALEAAGGTAVSLGPSILRIETAAISAAVGYRLAAADEPARDQASK